MHNSKPAFTFENVLNMTLTLLPPRFLPLDQSGSNFTWGSHSATPPRLQVKHVTALSLPQVNYPLGWLHRNFFLKKQFFNQCCLVTTGPLHHYLTQLPLFTILTLESKGLLCLPRPRCLTHTTFGGKPILPTANNVVWLQLDHFIITWLNCHYLQH